MLPIDKCLEYRIIDFEQHSSAIFFRRLYFMIYGDRFIKGISFSIYHKRKIELSQEQESRLYRYFMEIQRKLEKKGVHKYINDICVYDIEPAFLKDENYNRFNKQIVLLKKAFEELTSIMN